LRVELNLIIFICLISMWYACHITWLRYIPAVTCVCCCTVCHTRCYLQNNRLLCLGTLICSQSWQDLITSLCLWCQERVFFIRIMFLLA